MFLNEGIAEVWALVTGTGGVAFSNANTHIGVGDSATAAAATQTGLQAATNKLWKPMEATYPLITAQTCTWRAVFDGISANYAWNEFTITNGVNDTGKNLQRVVSAQGTKIAGQIWTLDIPFTLS
jgi:hypothetical protein